MKVEINGNVLELMVGDITKQETDVIVNAANGTLMGGGGVDGAIHRAAGTELLEECKQIRKEELNGNYLPSGEVVMTGAYHLPAKHIIHTVGPVWNGGKGNEEKRLSNCYRHSLQLAMENGQTSISFPSISTGVYRYPVALASVVALQTIIDFLQQHSFGKVVMVLYSEKDYDVYKQSLEKLMIP